MPIVHDFWLNCMVFTTAILTIYTNANVIRKSFQALIHVSTFCFVFCFSMGGLSPVCRQNIVHCSSAHYILVYRIMFRRAIYMIIICKTLRMVFCVDSTTPLAGIYFVKWRGIFRCYLCYIRPFMNCAWHLNGL